MADTGESTDNPDFLDALYDDGTESGQEEETVGNSDKEQDIHSVYGAAEFCEVFVDSGGTSPHGTQQRDTSASEVDLRISAVRDRSRSPIRTGLPPGFMLKETLLEKGVVINMVDEQGDELEALQDVFLPTDQHSVFEMTRTGQPTEARIFRARGERRRALGSRFTGKGRGDNRITDENHVKRPGGDPLKEKYLTDDDIPADMAHLARDVIHQRENRAGATHKKTRTEDDSSDEEFVDAGAKEDLFQLDTNFEWCSMESFQPREEPFIPKKLGPSEFHSTPYSAFRSYWDDGILEYIVQETNAYVANNTSLPFYADWVSTNIHEILVLYSFWMMLGIIRMPTIKSCFSSNHLLETSIFRRMFTRKRYNTLVRALRFVDSDNVPNNPSYLKESRDLNADRLHRIRPIFSHLNNKFQSNYTPSRNICIDESQTLLKSRLDSQQYIATPLENQTKAAKFGIRTFELCESVTGYLWSFFVYTGRHTSLDKRFSRLPKTIAIVLTLLEPLLNKGYRVFMNDWFNSPVLARFLKRNGTDCVGSLQTSRQHVPPILSLAQLQQGEMVGRHSGDVCVMVWRDKKTLTTISTCHALEQGLATVSPVATKELFKPQIVLDYTKYMGVVDLKDQVLEPYILERKNYLKLFKHLLSCSINNSRILLQSSTNVLIDQLDFRLRLVDSILSSHLSLSPVTRSQQRIIHHLPISRQDSQPHWPTRVPQTASDAAAGRQSRKHCFWCARHGRKHQKTPFRCEQCDVPLCIDDCFKSYHLVTVMSS